MLDQLTKPARVYNPGTWTAEQFEYLKECWAAGMSSGVTRDRLNQKFSADYTRNAVIGKVNRHALSVVFDRVRAAPTFSAAYSSERRRHVARRVKVARVFQTYPIPTPPPMPVEPLNVLFCDLADHHCREIVGKDGWESLSCGHPKLDTSSYCAWHHAINTWIPPSRSRPYFPMGGR